MNIFALSLNPRQAAQWHCDRHVVKMLLESTQLLWTAQHVTWGDRLDLASAPTTRSGRQGYRPTHKNHPCAIWIRTTLANYMWLCALAAALAEEYHYRYPTAPAHACEVHVTWLTAHPPPLPPGALTWPALAMPVEYKISPNPTTCYRAYYLGDKQERGLLQYTRRETPHWVVANDPRARKPHP
jgi:hypothetical protein